MQLQKVKVSSICNGIVCYEPDGILPFIGSSQGSLQGQVPTAVPFLRTQPAKTTWYGEIMRLLYETEMGKGKVRFPKMPPLPGGRR